MTTEELIKKLESAPKDADVLYLHNKYGKILIDTVEIKEEHTIAGDKFHTVTFSGSYKEEDD